MNRSHRMRPLRDRRGASLMGYALVVGLVAIVGITSVTSTGAQVEHLFGTVADELEGAGEGAAAGSGGQGSEGEATPSPSPSPIIPNPATCQDHQTNGATTSGIYQVDIDGTGGLAPINVYCDMVNDGGGWILLARDPGTGFDMPLPVAGSTAWAGNHASMEGLNALSYAQMKSWQGLSGQSRTATSVYASAIGTFSFNDSYDRLTAYLGGTQRVLISYNVSNRVATQFMGNGFGAAYGCPHLSNVSASEAPTYSVNMTQGTAGSGDTNAHNGGGCWGTPSTGPTSGEIWIR